MEVKSNTLINMIKGVLISFIITLILFYILGIILSSTSLPEKIITPAIIIITGVSILIGASISMIKSNDKGLIKGGLIGLFYFTIIYLCSSIMLKNFEVNVYSSIMLVACFICGSIGGVLGVNM